MRVISIVAAAIALMPVFSVDAGAQPSSDTMVVYLDCEDGGQLAIDFAAKTVNGKPAQIGPTTIDWESERNENPVPQIQLFIVNDHLNRLSGVLSTNPKITWASGVGPITGSPTWSQPHSFQCRKVSAPATKF